MAFRTNLRAYSNAWDFLSQVIDFQNPQLHRRAIVARLLERNLHDDSPVEVIDVSTVELKGVGVARASAETDYGLTEGGDGVLPAPRYEGSTGGGGQDSLPVALQEAIDEVNAIFSAAGVDLGTGSGASWTKAVWGQLTEDAEFQAMAAENTPEQLANSPKFQDMVNGAMVMVAHDSATMTEAATADADLGKSITEAIAKAASVSFGEK